MNAPKVSRRLEIEARCDSIEEALAFVTEQLDALALPAPTVSIFPVEIERPGFRRVHFLAVVKGTERRGAA